MAKTVGNIVGNFLVEQVDHLKWCCDDKTDGLDKVFRVAIAIIDIAGLAYGKSEVGQNLRGRIKNFRELWTVVQLVFRAQYWIGTSDSKPGYKNDHWRLIASNAVSGIGQVLESIKHMGTWGLLDLVNASKKLTDETTLQHLQAIPVLSIVIDILYTSSAAVLAVDRAIALAKGRRITKICDYKLRKWTDGDKLYRLAFPKEETPRNLEARSRLLDIYERKICFNQLKMQSRILTYTLATKFNGVLKDRQQLTEEDTEKMLADFGKSLLADIISAKAETMNPKDLLSNIEFFERRFGEFGGLSVKLRQLSLQVSNEIFNLNSRLALANSPSNTHKNATKEMKAKQVEDISKLYSKINKEQRIYQSFNTGSEETSQYFEWKCHKWTVKKMEHTLKTEKSINSLIELTLKVAGGVMSLAFTFNPIGTTFGSTVVPILTELQIAQMFKRECWKVAVNAIGSFFSYYALFETEKMGRELKAFKAASVYKDEKNELKKPTFETLEPFKNPLVKKNGALDPEAKFQNGQHSARIKEILALTDGIRCRQFGTKQRLEMRTGMFNAIAA